MKAILCLIGSLLAMSQPRPAPQIFPAPVANETTSVDQVSSTAPALSPARSSLLRVAAGEIGVREKTGNNDGARVEAYLSATGNAVGDPYCAAFVYWCARQAFGASNPFPRSAYSPDTVKGGTRDVSTARGGDAFGIYFKDKGRVAHTGLVERREGNFLVTIEGNTTNAAAIGSAADREAGKGGGVYRKRRPVSTIYSVKSWLP